MDNIFQQVTGFSDENMEQILAEAPDIMEELKDNGQEDEIADSTEGEDDELDEEERCLCLTYASFSASVVLPY